MAKGRKLTATSEFGTFTRTTHHDYKFVTIVLESEEARQDRIACWERNAAHYQNLIDTQEPGIDDQGRHWYKNGSFSQCLAKDMLADAQAQVVKLQQRERAFVDVNWCGRRDLAEKAAARLAKWGGYESIKIVAVDQPEGGR